MLSLICTWVFYIGNKQEELTADKLCRELYVKTNMIMSLFHCVRPDIKYKLFISYCASLYGVLFLNLSGANFDKLNKAWRKCVRRIWGISNITHGWILPLISNDTDLKTKIGTRLSSFLEKAKNSNIASVRLCSHMVMNGSGSNISRSVTHLCQNFNIDRCNLFDGDYPFSYFNDNVPENKLARASFIFDLIIERYRGGGFLEYEQITSILDCLCEC